MRLITQSTFWFELLTNIPEINTHIVVLTQVQSSPRFEVRVPGVSFLRDMSSFS